MADQFSKINANKQVKDIKQPNLTKQRHRFKGPRESHKVNLEMDQIRYDILNYSRQIAQLEAEIAEFYEYVQNTTEIGDVGELDSSILASFSGYLDVQMLPDASDSGLPQSDTIWDGGDDSEPQDEGTIDGGDS